MKIALLVTGDRNASMEQWWEPMCNAFDHAFGQSWDELILIHGDARGIDSLADQYYFIIDGVTIEPYRANWNVHGLAAGPIRNEQMLKRLLELRDLGYTPHVFAFHDSIETSKGTRGMCRLAYDAGLTVTLYTSDGQKREWRRS